MKQQYRYSFIALTLLMFGSVVTGCGSSSGKSLSVAQHVREEPDQPVQHIGHYSRNLEQKDFNPDRTWEYDNLEGLKMDLTEEYLYLQFTHNSNAENIQFFLDIDNNAQTGNSDEGGADYMVENGVLYQSVKPNEWSWKEIGAVESVIETGKSDTIGIKLEKLKNKSIVFKANAQALDQNWIPVVMSPADGTKSVYSKKVNINWETISAYSASNKAELKLFTTKENLYMHLEADKFPAHIQIYIDSDLKMKTGYKNDSWNNFGADYLVEDGYLYRYTGKGDWGWEEIDVISKSRSKGEKSVLEVVVPKRLLSNLTDKIKVGVELNNKKWTDTQLLPHGDLPTYELTPDSESNQVEISEVMAANTHTILDPDYFNFSDWIELHNRSDKTVDISGYQISDELNTPKWRLPNGTILPPDGYLLVWADEKDKQKKGLHTNFKLKMGGEAVSLFDTSGKCVDAFEYLKQLPDVSVAFQNGKEVYMNPTPGKANSQYFPSAIQMSEVEFSLEEGWYDVPELLTLTTKTGGTIYYTTDGSIPTPENGTKYSAPISIDRTMTVRAICTGDEKFSSPVVSKSYVYGESINLPVMMLSIDDKYLNDDKIGIYTTGTNGKTVECEHPITGNFMQKWERPAHIAYFDVSHSVAFTQDIGLKISGECSRKYEQKSFLLKADGKYGKEKIKYQLFPDKQAKKYKKIKLRNAGQDVSKAHLRDVLAHMIIKGQMHINYEAYQPVVLFLNGNYWGIYNMREKMGAEFIKSNYGLSKKKIDMIEDDLNVEAGSSEEYETLIEYIEGHSLQQEDAYRYVASKIDIENYIDYMITNLYVANSDWPGTNLVYWKEKKEGAKWQWLLHDMDFGFANYPEISDVDYDAIAKATTLNGSDWPNPPWSTLLFRKLLENTEFKKAFKNRMLQQLETTFSPVRVNNILDQIAGKIDPQIARHLAKWPLRSSVQNKADWDEEIQRIRTFVNQRPDILKQQLNKL